MNDYNYQIISNTQILSQKGERSKELNLVSWNDAPAKYEIRNWVRNEEGEFALKGVTLTIEELQILKDCLNSMLFQSTPAETFYSSEGIEYVRNYSRPVTPFDLPKFQR